jgi:hypothetical protein
VVKDFPSAYGIEKSAVSENFIEASREKVKQLMERPLGELHLCAVLIDGTPFKGRQMIAALGIGCDGMKTVLGIREGATENTAVVSSLLSELAERGLDFSTPPLYILAGGKALHASCGATPARRPSSNAARSTRSAMSSITCRKNIKPTSKGISRTLTRWRNTPTPSVLWTVCVAS